MRRIRRRGVSRIRFFLVAAVLLAAAFAVVLLGVRVYERQAYPLRYSELVERCAQEYGLEPSFLYAVIHTESRFDPNALSEAGAMGLMQITKDAFEWAQMRMGEKQALALETLYRPEVNIRYGSYIYSLLIGEFGSVDTAVCAYHAGRSNVRHWLQNTDYSSDGIHIEHIPYSNTRWYVQRIAKTRAIYQRLYHLK